MPLAILLGGLAGLVWRASLPARPSFFYAPGWGRHHDYRHLPVPGIGEEVSSLP